MSQVDIYTDGACSGNPGPGGWGALFRFSEEVTETLYGKEKMTTNNRMELTAAIKALQHLKSSHQVRLITDSEYLRQGITLWIERWKRNNWKTASGKPVKNKDLWCDLELATGNHEVDWVWVKGHAGNVYNEQADQLARQGAVEASLEVLE